MERGDRARLLPLVGSHLYDQDRPSRERAAFAMHRESSPVVVEQLLGHLGVRDRYIRTRAAWGLTLVSPRLSVPSLARLLSGKNAIAGRQAAWALGRIRDRAALRALIKALYDPRQAIHMRAAAGLWAPSIRGFRSRPVERRLAELLQKDRGHAAMALGNMLKHRTTYQSPALKKPRPEEGSVFERMGGNHIR